MNTSAIYIRTDKGIIESRSQDPDLPARMRTLLLLVDGRTPVNRFSKLLPNFGDVDAMFEALEIGGYVIQASLTLPPRNDQTNQQANTQATPAAAQDLRRAAASPGRMNEDPPSRFRPPTAQEQAARLREASAGHNTNFGVQASQQSASYRFGAALERVEKSFDGVLPDFKDTVGITPQIANRSQAMPLSQAYAGIQQQAQRPFATDSDTYHPEALTRAQTTRVNGHTPQFKSLVQTMTDTLSKSTDMQAFDLMLKIENCASLEDLSRVSKPYLDLAKEVIDSTTLKQHAEQIRSLLGP